MKSLPLQNIYNNFSTIYYSYREGKELKIEKDNSFKPFFYEENVHGQYKGYDGTKLTKIYTKAPHEIPRMRTDKSWEADVLYCKRWVISNLDEIKKSKYRYIAYDIEVDAKDNKFPDPKKAEYPITIIRVYDNYTDERKTFDFREYDTEYDMLEDFCKWIKEKSPDCLMAWNHHDFDYLYLYNRIVDFPKKISPISMEQYRGKENPTYPALITCLDLLALDYKMTLGKRDSYALDEVLQEEFEEEDTWGETNWSDYDKVRAKCENDVERMLKLMQKLNYLDHYDEIRRETCCLWEDIEPKRLGYGKWQSNNSKPIDMMFLKEAQKLNIVLPSKQSDLESESYEGAYREAFIRGSIKNVGKYDISSAYPSAIVDFCLDPVNYNENNEGLPIQIISRNNEKGEIHYFKQDPNTILPIVVNKLLKMKNDLKEKLKKDPNNKILEMQYDTKKSLINSLYGVLGNRFFRLYKKQVAETDTFLIRDLLHYIKDKIEERGYKVIYIDTDSFFVEGKEDISNLLNRLVQEWSMKKYKKETNIQFEYEGNFENLFIVALCRYMGRLRKFNGELKDEIKGLQMKRRDATGFVKRFQEELLNNILDGYGKEKIFNEIKRYCNDIENEDIFDIGKPVKLSKPREDYKKKEIFFRGLDNSNMEVRVGEKFFWIYILDKEKDVIAFNKDNSQIVNDIDYTKIIESQVFNVLVPIFRGLQWGKELLDLAEEYGIILKSDYRNQLLEEYNNFDELKEYYSARVAKKRMKKEKEIVK